MSLKQSPPGEGGERAREQFSYFNTPAGLKAAWTGWMAAAPWWFIGHEHKKHDPGTQPCLTWMTDGEVRCVRCGRGAEKKRMCYCHIYREFDGKPLLVVTQENVADAMFGVEYRTHVLVGRLDGQASSFVRPSETAVPFKTVHEHRKRAIDIAVSLLPIWKLEALAEWYHGRKRGVVPAAPTPAEAPVAGRVVANWNRFVELGSVGALEGSVSDPATHRNEQFVAEANGARPAPSKNGKHKPPA